MLTRPERWVNTNGSIAYSEGMGISFVAESPLAEAFRQAQKSDTDAQRKKSIPKF